MPFVSYASNFEDVMLWRALGSVSAGFFIDLDAEHPDLGSVTRAFYDRGWTGINVQPAADPFRRLAASRPRDVNLQHSANGRTLADICRAHAPGAIHFMRIGADAHEWLKSADFTRYRPWIALVQAVEPATHAPNHAPWEGLLLAAGYAFAWFDGLNRFYLDVAHEDVLRPHFVAPPNLFDDFIRADGELTRQIADMHSALTATRAEADFAVLRAQNSDARFRDALQARTHLHQSEAQMAARTKQWEAELDWRRGLQAEAEAEAGLLRDEIVWRRGVHAEAEGTIEALKTQIEALQSAIDRCGAVAAELATIQASTAWRITGPARRLLGRIKAG